MEQELTNRFRRNTWGRSLRLWFRNYLDDLLIVVGFALLAIGVYHLQPVLTWFVGGVEFLVCGFLLAWSKRK